MSGPDADVSCTRCTVATIRVGRMEYIIYIIYGLPRIGQKFAVAMKLWFDHCYFIGKTWPVLAQDSHLYKRLFNPGQG